MRNDLKSFFVCAIKNIARNKSNYLVFRRVTLCNVELENVYITCKKTQDLKECHWFCHGDAHIQECALAQWL